MAVGALLHIPAAFSANFIFFLVALFVLASGLTILQTASNPYLVHIGPKKVQYADKYHGFGQQGAGVLVPFVFTILILADIGDISQSSLLVLSEEEKAATLNELSMKLVMPYLYMAMVLCGLIALVKFSSLPEIKFEETELAQGQQHGSILQFPQTVLGAVALFAYVGVEVIAGDTIGLYGSSLALDNFAGFTSYTMSFMVIGYIIGVVAIPKYLSQEKALIGSALQARYVL